jgi:hypothetical protein
VFENIGKGLKRDLEELCEVREQLQSVTVAICERYKQTDKERNDSPDKQLKFEVAWKFLNPIFKGIIRNTN